MAQLAQQAINAIAKHGSAAAAARALSLPITTVKDRREHAQKLGLTPTVDVGADTAAKLRAKEGEVKELKRRLEAAERDRLDEKEVEAKIFQLARADVTPPDWLIKIKPGTSGAGVPTIMLSDWHFGEIVKSAEINGLNTYNFQVAETRFRRAIERTVDLAKNHMTGADYPGIVVVLNGDMISGEIHDELKDTNEDPVYGVVLWAVERIVWGLKALADQFGKVYVVITFGNHGRQDRKPRAKTRAKRNADWLIGKIVQSHLRDDRRFTFNAPLSGDAYFRIYGHRYLATHGDALGVRGGDGIIGAIGPIMRGEIKTANSESSVGRAYDTLLLGHWHQTLWLPRAIVNNCGKGYDEFARFFLRAPFSLPSQSLWFTHPKWGITARWEVMLEGGVPAKEAKALPWVSAFPEAA